MSPSALPPDVGSANAEARLKSRINAALGILRPKEVFTALASAEDSGKAFALFGTNLKLFSVPQSKVSTEDIERTFCGEGTGEYDLWLNVAQSDIRYGEDVVESDLFGPHQNGRLTAEIFALNREKIDLCNLFFVCARGMVDLQELPALNKLQHQLARRGLQVYTALAMKMPGEMSMKPYEAEVVLAVSKASDEQPPLFNLGPHRVMVSNYGGRQSPKPKPLSPFSPKALYRSAGT
jgi:hypothetical protein